MANPLATLLSGVMLFDYLGEPGAADALERAVADQLADPDAPRTPDLGGSAGTREVAEDVLVRR